MIKEKLGLDDKDMNILSWYMQAPLLSQQEIARRLQLSQPSVNMRIQKLTARGILSFHAGLNLRTSNLIMFRVDFTAKDAHAVLQNLKNCAFFVNGFIMSGKNNVSVFLVCDDLKQVDAIINEHIRSSPQISDISVNIVVNAAQDFPFKIDLQQELSSKPCFAPGACESCGRLLEHRPSELVKLWSKKKE